MKTFSSILIFVLVINHNYSQQGWFTQTSGTINYLYSASFVNSNTGWVSGAAGTVLKTTNSGINWFTQNTLTIGYIYSIFFIDSNTGWVVGENGEIEKTTNSGSSWHHQFGGHAFQYFYSVFFINANTGYIVGSIGAIINTTDGGLTWLPQSSGVYYTLNCVYFPPSGTSRTGFAVGGLTDIGVILKTTDAGLNWSQNTVGSNWLYGVYFNSAGFGYAVGANGVILASTDLGSTWFPQSSGSTERLVSVNFPNSETGFAVGYTGRIIKTSNRGENWFSQISPAAQNLSAVYFTDVNTGWAAGWNGTILHTTNGGLTYVQKIGSEVPEKFSLYQNYPNPFNPSTKIVFDVPAVRNVSGVHLKLEIYNILGEKITGLIDEELLPGTYKISWNAFGYTSGIYFYRLSAGEYTQTNKMILIK